MSDSVEPPEPPNKPLDANVKAATAATSSSSSSAYVFPPEWALRKKLGGPTTPETARVVCAALIGLALGVACGWWINIRLAAAYMPTQSPARLLPDAHAAGRTATATTTPENPPGDHGDTPSAPAEAAPPNGSDVKAVAETARTNPAATAVETRRGKVGSVDDEAPAAEPREPTARARGRAGPCALYASAGALNIRNGGAASLVLGTTGGQGGVTVTTPHWAHIAVFSEGRAGGGKGWLKYSVRSVSKKAGAYTLQVRTPCGSQTIPVTVARP